MIPIRYSEARGTLIYEKTWSRKSRVRLPLIHVSIATLSPQILGIQVPLSHISFSSPSRRDPWISENFHPRSHILYAAVLKRGMVVKYGFGMGVLTNPRIPPPGAAERDTRVFHLQIKDLRKRSSNKAVYTLVLVSTYSFIYSWKTRLQYGTQWINIYFDR